MTYPQTIEASTASKWRWRLLTMFITALLFLTFAIVFRNLIKSTHLILSSSGDSWLIAKVALLSLPKAFARAAPPSLLLGVVLALRPTGSRESVDSLISGQKRASFGVPISFLVIATLIFSMTTLFWLAPQSQRALQLLVTATIRGPGSNLAVVQALPPGPPRSATIGQLTQLFSDNIFEEKRRIFLIEIVERISVPLSCLPFGALAFLITLMDVPWRNKVYLSIGAIIVYYTVANVGGWALGASLWFHLLLPITLLLATIVVFFRWSDVFTAPDK